MKYIAITIIGIACLLAVMPSSLLADFVHGYVRDAETGQPIQNASVYGQHLFTAHTFQVYTDSSGFYTVADSTLPSGQWRMTASHPWYFSQSRTENLPTPNNINFSLTPR